MLVNNCWHDFLTKVFVEFSADERRMTCGNCLDLCAEVSETFHHHISRGLIFKWYDNLDVGCSHFD